MKLTLGFSPCPNDTYIFDALVNGRISSGAYRFDTQLADVENLNRMAFEGELDVTKLSFAVFAQVSHHYQLIPYGAALGFANGPLIISKKKIYPDELPYVSIAVPGKHTTAVLLLGIFWPGAKQQKEFLFSDIEEAVLSGETDAGLIIHETRFTYRDKGLRLISDLGEKWEKETGKPLPLGGIAVRRSLSETVKIEIANLVSKSLNHARNFPADAQDYIQQNARETSPLVTRQHIDLYVNKYSDELGKEGKDAILYLLQKGAENNIIPEPKQPVFI